MSYTDKARRGKSKAILWEQTEGALGWGGSETRWRRDRLARSKLSRGSGSSRERPWLIPPCARRSQLRHLPAAVPHCARPAAPPLRPLQTHRSLPSHTRGGMRHPWGREEAPTRCISCLKPHLWVFKRLVVVHKKKQSWEKFCCERRPAERGMSSWGTGLVGEVMILQHACHRDLSFSKNASLYLSVLGRDSCFSTGSWLEGIVFCHK